MNKRIRVNGVLYEAVDLRLKPPRYNTIRGTQEFFYDKSIGTIQATVGKSNKKDRVVTFSALIDRLSADFTSVRISFPDEDVEHPLFRGIQLSLDGTDYILNDPYSKLSDHDLQLIFDNIVSDIFYKLDLSDWESFVHSVKVSARRAALCYDLEKEIF